MCILLEDDEDLTFTHKDVNILNNKCRNCIFNVNMLFYSYEDMCIYISETDLKLEICIGTGYDTDKKYFLPSAAELETDLTLYNNYIKIFFAVDNGDIEYKK